MTGVKKKRLVLCADDFGMNSGIDAGILQLAALRRLNAASCLAEGPSFVENAAALDASGLQCGLHLNFTESLGAPGFYLPVSSLIVRAYLRRLDAPTLRSQIARQLDRFEAVMGRPPDFVDGHQHVHQLPQIRDALLAELAQRYPQAHPWVRRTRAGLLAGLPWRLRRKAHIIQLLGSRRLARQARAQGFAMNAGFLGVYDFQGGYRNYQALLGLWLKQAVDGDELMCHPASRADNLDLLGEQRVAEFEVLASRQTGQWLDDYGIEL